MYKVHLLIIIIIIIIALAGCARPETVVTQLYPKPNTCQIDTARPDYLSNSTFTNCWGPNGEHIGLLGGSGTTPGKVMMGNIRGIIKAGAGIGAAVGVVGVTD